MPSVSYPPPPRPDDPVQDLEALQWLVVAESGSSWVETDSVRLTDLLEHEEKVVRRQAGLAMAAALRRGSLSTNSCESLLREGTPACRWGVAFALLRSGIVPRPAVATEQVARTEPAREESGHGIVAAVNAAPPESLFEALTEALVATLGDSDGDLRWAAGSELALLARDCVAVRDRLCSCATDDSDPARRKMALLCLCEAGECDGAIYRGGLRDRDPFVRMAALTALARSGDNSAQSLAAITQLETNDDVPGVRRAAAAVHRRLQANGKPKDS